jgi:hypothetical protein
MKRRKWKLKQKALTLRPTGAPSAEHEFSPLVARPVSGRHAEIVRAGRRPPMHFFSTVNACSQSSDYGTPYRTSSTASLDARPWVPYRRSYQPKAKRWNSAQMRGASTSGGSTRPWSSSRSCGRCWRARTSA